MAADDPFFSPLEDPPEPMDEWDPLSQPDWQRVPFEVVPAVVGEVTIVAESAEFAIVLAPVLVYDRGLVLELTLIRNPWGSREAVKLMTAQHGPHDRADGSFRAGVRWADGRVARSDQRPHWAADAPPAASMITRGGGGSGEATGTAWWVWPLPADGDLEVIVEFIRGGILETAHTLDGDAIRAGAARTTPIWPPAGREPSA